MTQIIPEGLVKITRHSRHGGKIAIVPQRGARVDGLFADGSFLLITSSKIKFGFGIEILAE